jgi:dynein heavy chain
MSSTVAKAILTHFMLINFYKSNVEAITDHYRLPTYYTVAQLCQSEQLLSLVKEDVATILQDVTQNVFSDVPQCGNGTWKRIAYLDMSNVSYNCPANWTFYALSGNNVRSCGRPEAERGGESCTSVFISSGNYEYHRMCGRATGYQISTTDAFGSSQGRQSFPHTINDAYVDGLSLTHGSNRAHIWTFAAGHSEANDSPFACYCGDNSTHGTLPPEFVGQNFFCESAVNAPSYPQNTFYSQDPLWDGLDCGPHTNCCTFNSPPWFSVQLPTSTTDDVEARICLDEANEDVTIGLLEIYVQ